MLPITQSIDHSSIKWMAENNEFKKIWKEVSTAHLIYYLSTKPRKNYKNLIRKVPCLRFEPAASQNQLKQHYHLSKFAQFHREEGCSNHKLINIQLCKIGICVMLCIVWKLHLIWKNSMTVHTHTKFRVSSCSAWGCLLWNDVRIKTHDNLLIGSKFIRADRHRHIYAWWYKYYVLVHNLLVNIKINLTWILVELLPLQTNE
jgi:hypothetical protein